MRIELDPTIYSRVQSLKQSPPAPRTRGIFSESNLAPKFLFCFGFEMELHVACRIELSSSFLPAVTAMSVLDGVSPPAMHCAVSDEGKSVAMSSSCRIVFFSLKNPSTTHAAHLRCNCTCLVWLHERAVASGHVNGSIMVHNPEGVALAEFSIHNAPVKIVRLSPATFLPGHMPMLPHELWCLHDDGVVVGVSSGSIRTAISSKSSDPAHIKLQLAPQDFFCDLAVVRPSRRGLFDQGASTDSH